MRIAGLLLLLMAGCTWQPSPTVIHICDYHFVDRETFAADLRDLDSGLEKAPDCRDE